MTGGTATCFDSARPVEKALELETELIRDGWVLLGYNHERRSSPMMPAPS